VKRSNRLVLVLGPSRPDDASGGLGITPQQAELIRSGRLDGTLTLLLRSPQDAASADATTTGSPDDSWSTDTAPGRHASPSTSRPEPFLGTERD